jgi:hypothetical protein
MSTRILAAAIVAFTMTTAATRPARAEIREVYIGRDGLSTLASGDYKGLPNPNYGRLTLLYAHGDAAKPETNHYHGIGAYSYTGAVPNQSVLSTNANNKLPEGYTNQAPLSLRPGAGLYAGRLRTTHDPKEHYSDLSFHSVHELSRAATGTPEHYMFNSSGNRWSGSLVGSVVWLELVSLSNGLQVGSEQSLDVLATPGQRVALGTGDAIDFKPVLWVAGNAPRGTYAATFKLVDTGPTAFGESGTFSILVAVP